MRKSAGGHLDTASASSTPMNPLCTPAGDATASSCTVVPAARHTPGIPAPGDQGQQSASQGFPQATPVPVHDTTPQDWPEGPHQSEHARPEEPYLHPVSLFDQLGPHPMQSLTHLPAQPQHASAAANVRASLTARHARAADPSRSASIGSAAGSSDGSHDSFGAEPASARIDHEASSRGAHGAVEGGGAGHAAGGDANGQVPVRRSLLPPVLPKYRTSPLRTPKPGSLHASYAVPRPAAQPTWRRSADASLVAAAPNHKTVPTAAAAAAAGPTLAAPVGAVGDNSLQHAGAARSVSFGDAGVAAGMAVRSSHQHVSARERERMAHSIQGEGQGWRRGEAEAEAVQRSAPSAVHRYADAGSLGSKEDNGVLEEEESMQADSMREAASKPGGESFAWQQAADESPSLPSSSASEEVCNPRT